MSLDLIPIGVPILAKCSSRKDNSVLGRGFAPLLADTYGCPYMLLNLSAQLTLSSLPHATLDRQGLYETKVAL